MWNKRGESGEFYDNRIVKFDKVYSKILIDEDPIFNGERFLHSNKTVSN